MRRSSCQAAWLVLLQLLVSSGAALASSAASQGRRLRGRSGADADAAADVGAELAKRCAKGPVPLLFDMDADYDDFLALLYLARHPLFDIRAITVSATGFGTPHGAPTNVAAVAALLGKQDVPIAYGHLPALSPTANYPLSWRLKLDEFFERLYANGTAEGDHGGGPLLEMTSSAISPLPAPKLILKVLREAECPVVVLTTGPLTNLAVALQDQPEAANQIRDVFMMGSTYGGHVGANILDSMLKFNGVFGACTEDGGATYTGLSSSLSIDDGQGGERSAGVRPGCRGLNMTEKGDTEWNIFSDALAWHSALRLLASAERPPRVRIFTSGASEALHLDAEEVRSHASALAEPRLRGFALKLAEGFLSIGEDEVRWWDPAAAVMMAETLTGLDAEEGGICSEWALERRTTVSMVWRSVLGEGELNPFGSVRDDPKGSPADYCTNATSSRMSLAYWPAVNNSRFPSGTRLRQVD